MTTEHIDLETINLITLLNDYKELQDKFDADWWEHHQPQSSLAHISKHVGRLMTEATPAVATVNSDHTPADITTKVIPDLISYAARIYRDAGLAYRGLYKPMVPCDFKNESNLRDAVRFAIKPLDDWSHENDHLSLSQPGVYDQLPVEVLWQVTIPVIINAAHWLAAKYGVDPKEALEKRLEELHQRFSANA